MQFETYLFHVRVCVERKLALWTQKLSSSLFSHTILQRLRIWDSRTWLARLNDRKVQLLMGRWAQLPVTVAQLRGWQEIRSYSHRCKTLGWGGKQDSPSRWLGNILPGPVRCSETVKNRDVWVLRLNIACLFAVDSGVHWLLVYDSA